MSKFLGKIRLWVSLSLIATIILASQVFATSIGKTIDVVYRDMKIMIDNTEQTPSEDMKPFIHNGRTFLSLRFVSEALYKNVRWEDATSTAYIDGVYVPQNEKDAITKAFNAHVEHMQSKNLNGVMNDLSKSLHSSVRNGTYNVSKDLFENYELSIKLISLDIIDFNGKTAEIRVSIETKKTGGYLPDQNIIAINVQKMVKENGEWKLTHTYIESIENL